MNSAEPKNDVDAPPLAAGVDLGSNSFHMVIARVVDNQLHVVDRVRERVRLASGIDDKGRISKDAQERALECLERFGQIIRKSLGANMVRAVGTNTMRRAKNARKFFEAAEAALGAPIEIISGREEARLIYFGVSSLEPDPEQQRLVIDIGGGSTECIIGKGLETLLCDSFFMGCVTYTQRYFPDGVITREGFDEARLAAKLELRSRRRAYRKRQWDVAIGCSGTLLAADRVLREQGWSEEGLTAKGLRKLRKAMIAAGHVDELSLEGLAKERAQVFPGGVAIISAIVDSLDIELVKPSERALREGILFDLLGRNSEQDVREQTISNMSNRYQVDQTHATRVENTAAQLLEQVNGWGLDPARGKRMLSWAAKLHEIGLSIGYTGYHKHAEYLIRHSDMPGFARQTQALLATIVRCHRRRIRSEYFEEFGEDQSLIARRLTLLFRLAVRLNRDRSDDPLPTLELGCKKDRCTLTFPNGWLDDHALTRVDLDRESALVNKGLGITFSYREA